MTHKALKTHVLCKQLTSFFDVSIQLALTLAPQTPMHFLYTPLLEQPKTQQERTRAFVGQYMCGPQAFVTKYALEQLGHHVVVWENQQGSGDYATDHCFLLVDDCFVVDMTYRQILQHDCSTSIECPYFQKLHYEHQPFFVGTPDDLFVLCEDFQRIHSQTYNHLPSTEFSMKHNLRRWECQTEVNARFTMPTETSDTLPNPFAHIKHTVDEHLVRI